jgi:hypothetical protein
MFGENISVTVKAAANNILVTQRKYFAIFKVMKPCFTRPVTVVNKEGEPLALPLYLYKS